MLDQKTHSLQVVASNRLIAQGERYRESMQLSNDLAAFILQSGGQSEAAASQEPDSQHSETTENGP